MAWMNSRDALTSMTNSWAAKTHRPRSQNHLKSSETIRNHPQPRNSTETIWNYMKHYETMMKLWQNVTRYDNVTMYDKLVFFCITKTIQDLYHDATLSSLSGPCPRSEVGGQAIYVQHRTTKLLKIGLSEPLCTFEDCQPSSHPCLL